MRITKVTVNNLFGIFNHEIPLNIENNITLIHGPNGHGKTTILSMMNAFFNSRYFELRRIPFSRFSVHFEDKSCLQLERSNESKVNKEDNNDDEIIQLNIMYTKDGQNFTYTVPSINTKDITFPLGAIEHEIPGIKRIGTETWIYLPTQEKLSINEIMDRFHDRLPFGMPLEIKNEPEWLKIIKNSINIGFIETQRLLKFSYSHNYRKYDGRPPMVPAVINYSEELTDTIQTKLAEYGSLSQSLDRTFPTRLVKGSVSSELTISELNSKLNELEEKRSRLMDAGLLEKEEIIDFKELIDESNKNVLSVYIHDVQEKLQVFDEFTDKIDLLVSIINKKFHYKEMSISKKEGFIFKTLDGNDLSPTNLSSGEQHELVLLYELLFKVTPNSLILIDEPELSLNVVWQQQFLKDLQEITKLSQFDVFIATHSPQIIHDRWDLTIELKGPLDEK